MVIPHFASLHSESKILAFLTQTGLHDDNTKRIRKKNRAPSTIERARI